MTNSNSKHDRQSSDTDNQSALPMPANETTDANDRRNTRVDGHATDRRTFLKAVGVSAVSVGIGSASATANRQVGSRTTAAIPWTESFEVADGTTSDDGETAWQIENDDAHPEVAVESNALTARETDGVARWRSEAIDISTVETVELAVSVRGSGPLEAPPDPDPPAVTGSSEPTDPDDDGIYEDVDGDEDLDIDDANTLLTTLDDPAVAENAEAYDSNCNDRVDYIDVVALAGEIRGNGASSGDCPRVGDELTVAYVVDGEKTVVTQVTDVASDGETIETTGLSGEQLRVEITARTADPETAYHVEKVSVAQSERTTIVADRAPDGSRLTTRPDGPAYHTTDGSVHLFTWDEPGPGARAVLYDEDESTDWGGGPDIYVYDTMERSDASAGEFPSPQATHGMWDRYSYGVGKDFPTLNSDSHSGEYSARVQHQDRSNKFMARFPETTEVFLSYCVKIPEGKAMPGSEAPGEFANESTLKLAWLMHEGTGGDVDIVLPNYTGGDNFNLHSNSIENFSVSGNSWWQWGEWMRLSFWLECGPEPESDPGRIRFQAVTEGEGTQVLVDRTRPIMVGGTPPFTWKELDILGWAKNKQVSGDNVEVLYDDIYLATGDDSNARLELSDSTDYAASTRIQLCDIQSWRSNRVSATLRTGSLDSVENATLHLTTADEEQAVSMEVN